jgi:hypothetical protein
MHYTKDGKYLSEADCQNWFKRPCKCGHNYGKHFGSNESCMHTDSKGEFCSCKKFKLKKIGS